MYILTILVTPSICTIYTASTQNINDAQQSMQHIDAQQSMQRIDAHRRMQRIDAQRRMQHILIALLN